MSALRKYDQVSVWDVPFADILEVWHERTNGYKDQRAIRALCQWDRYFLLVQVCGRKDMLHPWLYERCREVEREPENCIDLWAREHYKSTIITFGGTLQDILRDPEVTIGIFSHTATQARSFLSQIKRELDSNEKLKNLFPDILWNDPAKEAPVWSNEAIIVRRKSNPKEPTVGASGLIDGMPTGMHFSKRKYDDIVTRESVTTPEQVQKSIDAYSLSQSLGTQDGTQQIIGTRYSYSDAYDWMMRRGSLKVRIHPATKDGTIDGKPVFFSQQAWEERVRNQTEADLACQMLQNPLAGQQRMFNIEDLQVYEIRPETLAVYILVDPARSVKKDSADTAMLAIGVDYANNKYLLDGFAHKMDLKARWEHLARLYLRWKQAPGVQQVKVGYEAFGAQADLDYFKEQQKLHGLHFDIAELAWPRSTEGSKTDRVQRLGPDLRSHKFYLPYPTDEKNYTSTQRKMLEGYEYRIARPIKRKNENNEIYDLSEKFKLQVHYFPMGLKDVVDAASRIYDMEPRPPTYREVRYAEPEFC